jgi:raffinose/stachyose/melibiose transport system permease protein
VSALRRFRSFGVEGIALGVTLIVFVVPFVFVLFIASKTRPEASGLDFALPTQWVLIDNLVAVITNRNNLMVTAMRNSIILTVASVSMIVVFSAMVAYVLARRRDRVGNIVTALILAGLVIPPAVVPTIFVLQSMGLFKTLFGLILVEVAFTLPFSVLVFRAFVGSIPRELDEAAIIDGASPFKLFLHVIFPLLRPAIITVIVVNSVVIYNDFVNPLYFLPGNENATVQLTLFQYQSQFSTAWNLLFADVLLITIPPLIMFIFFQRQLVSGLTAGSVKG